MSNAPKIVGIDYLAPLVGRAASTIKVDVSRRPETLPPRLVIPGSNKVMWLESDVLAWLNACRTAKPPIQIFRRKANRAFQQDQPEKDGNT